MKAFATAVVLVACSLGATRQSFAVDRLVPEQFTTIQAAIDAATPGDVVSIAAGTYAESINLRGKAMTLRARVTGQALVVAPSAQRCIIATSYETADTQVVGLRFQRNTAATSGGGALLSGSSVRFQDCIFDSCVNPEGGGIRVTGGSPTINRCTFTGCVATGPAGGIYGSAGGIHAVGSSLLILDSVFINCDGNCAADALLNDGGGAVTIRNSNISGGGASTCFGQIYNASGSLLVEDSTFEGGNKAGIFAWSPYTVRRCTFRAMTGYAALERRSGQYNIESCRFENCRTSGPLFMSYYSGAYLISNCTFCSTTWTGNMVQGSWVDGGGNTSVADCTQVTGVIPASGPAAGGTTVQISGSDFPDNPSVNFGGSPAVNVVRVSSTRLTATTPANLPGISSISVNGFALADAFYYRPYCGSDLDQNGSVDAADISIILLDFGPCYEPPAALAAPAPTPLLADEPAQKPTQR